MYFQETSFFLCHGFVVELIQAFGSYASCHGDSSRPCSTVGTFIPKELDKEGLCGVEDRGRLLWVHEVPLIGDGAGLLPSRHRSYPLAIPDLGQNMDGLDIKRGRVR